jgi:hypothetical protein
MAGIVPALVLIVAVSPARTAVTQTSSLTSTADTKVSEKAPTTTYGGATTLSADVDRAGGSGTNEYALLRWDLSSLPAGSKVSSASITLDVTNGSKDTYQIYALQRAWTERAATWQLYDSGSPWQVAGARGSLDREAKSAGSVATPKVGKQSFVLSSALVQSWLDSPPTNNGIIIADSTNVNGFDFSSRESATVANRPRLNVTYTTTGAPDAPRATT